MALEPIDYSIEQPRAAAAGPGFSLAQTDVADEPEETAQDFRIDEATRLSMREQVDSVKWEMAGALGYMTALNIWKLTQRDLSGFQFVDEGYFGRNTTTLGVDKMVHAHNAYMLSELIGARIRAKTGTRRGTAVTGALLGSGLMLYSEFYDGFKGGFSFQDLLFNSLGAGFSVLRTDTPGLEEKLDFRFLLIPTANIYEPKGEQHYRQLRHLLALKLAGFRELERTPLRLVELHLGYYGKGFTDEEEALGQPRQRKVFFGVGLNVSELLFGHRPRTRAARAASEALDYWQPPYTYVHAD